MKIRTALTLASLAGLTLSASAHIHTTVDTVSGSPGDQILFVPGYLPAEASYSLEDGYLKHDGEIAEFPAVVALAQAGPLHDWVAGDEILFTSDFYFATGRLDGGNFMWEIVGIERVDGTGTAELAWGEFGVGGTFMPMAMSDGATREARSFDTAIGQHNHDQGYAFSDHGLYDVKFVIWDSNGKYKDSEAFKIRFLVEDGNACHADCDGSGALNIDDFICFQTEFALGETHADCDENGMLNIDDFICFQTLFALGC
jgi:hypothetical protein